MAIKVPVDDLGLFSSRERGFNFPLPTTVEGQNARGREFREDTVLSYINHQGSSFYLRNPVNIGVRLRLVIDLPEKLSQDKSLKLVIRGRVARVEGLRESGGAKKVMIHFDSKYVIKPEE
ncbi:MAG: PilZ domain-containing protein [Candidatus Aminicenantes bacterium]|nr:PilZ domain-containing protein [Candidatus Aminicenantes bacterium]